MAEWLMYAQRRDKNEAEIVAALRAPGAVVIYMDKSAGFDLLIAFQGVLHVIEVKMPGKEKDLTEAEEETMREMFDIGGVDYNIVTTPEEALQLIER